jgi:hypothetical protein
LSRDGRRGTPITGIGELTTNDGDDGSYATLNNAALVISGDRVTWTGPASRGAGRGAGRLDARIGPTPLEQTRWSIGTETSAPDRSENGEMPLG